MGKAEEWLKGFKEFWNEYKRYKSGLAGLALLLILAGVAICAPLIAPKEAYDNWYEPEYWQDNPRAVPPVWVNFFTAKKKVPHKIFDISPSQAQVKIEGSTKTYTIRITYDFEYDEPPNDLMVRVCGELAGDEEASVTVSVKRPDGNSIVLATYKTVFPETYKGLPAKSFRLSSSGENIVNWARQFDPKGWAVVKNWLPRGPWVIRVLFSKTEEGMLIGEAGLLKGKYVFTITVKFYNPGDKFFKAMFIVFGTAYGLMGTDAYGKDLFVGIVWGTRLALLIGILTSLISTLVGVLYGVVSAYIGGLVDEAMMRIYEIVASIPLLPVLLILSWKFGVTVWNLAFIMALFWWTGPVRTVRSMALQIKEETYVEAAKAIGVGTRRMIMKYIANQILPYAFAVMALGVPGAILTEAGVSFLLGGRGVREPTWGKILNEAHRAAATMNGLWWWVLSPGLMICITGLTFVLIGNALDRILNPMLRR